MLTTAQAPLDIAITFGHRWRIKGECVVCQYGTIRAIAGDTLEVVVRPGAVARQIAKLACVRVMRNDETGIVGRFQSHRIHDVARLVEPLAK